MKDLKPFQDVLQRLCRRYPVLSQRIDEGSALLRWEKAVGPAVARHAKVKWVKDSVLFVEVEHPIWRSELHHRKQQIIDILNHKIDQAGQRGGEQAPPRAAQERAPEVKHRSGVIQDIVFIQPQGAEAEKSRKSKFFAKGKFQSARKPRSR
jgi:predicted nucleic acid-binding Zn ribbon protein